MLNAVIQLCIWSFGDSKYMTKKAALAAFFVCIADKRVIPSYNINQIIALLIG